MAEVIKAELREGTGTRPARKLRRGGLVPATLYGHGKPAASIKLNQRELERAVEHGEHLLSIKIGSKPATQALIRELQYDPIGGHIIHADFAEVAMNEKVKLTVPLVLHGTPAGAKEGGTIEHVLHEIEIECLVAKIPQEIRIEVAGLGINDHINVGGLELPEGVETDADPEELVVTCRAAAEEVEEEAAPPEEGEVMPEVITERKEEGEGPAETEG